MHLSNIVGSCLLCKTTVNKIRVSGHRPRVILVAASIGHYWWYVIIGHAI